MQVTITPAAAAFLANAGTYAEALPTAHAEALRLEPDTQGLLVDYLDDGTHDVPLLRLIVQTTCEPNCLFHLRSDDLLTLGPRVSGFVSEHVKLYRMHRARHHWPNG